MDHDDNDDDDDDNDDDDDDDDGDDDNDDDDDDDDDVRKFLTLPVAEMFSSEFGGLSNRGEQSFDFR